MGAIRVPQHCPKCQLDASLGDANGMVDAISSTLGIGSVIFAESPRHVTCENVIGIDVWQFQEALFNSPFYHVSRSSSQVAGLLFIATPDVLEVLILCH